MLLANCLNKSEFLGARFSQNSPILPAGFVAAEHFLETQFFDIRNLPADSLKEGEFCGNFKCGCYFLIVHLLSAKARQSLGKCVTRQSLVTRKFLPVRLCGLCLWSIRILFGGFYSVGS